MVDINEIYETLSQLKDNLSKYIGQVDEAKDLVAQSLREVTRIMDATNQMLAEELAERYATYNRRYFAIDSSWTPNHYRIYVKDAPIHITVEKAKGEIEE